MFCLRQVVAYATLGHRRICVRKTSVMHNKHQLHTLRFFVDGPCMAKTVGWWFVISCFLMPRLADAFGSGTYCLALGASLLHGKQSEAGGELTKMSWRAPGDSLGSLETVILQEQFQQTIRRGRDWTRVGQTHSTNLTGKVGLLVLSAVPYSALTIPILIFRAGR